MQREPSRKIEDYGEILTPSEAAEPILAKPVRTSLMEWLTEIWAASDLVEVGLKPRKRALFHGAPGTGKTTLAHHIAARLGLDMLVVRPERFKTTYVSESARGIGALFDALRARREPVFLFFDEFDSLAAKRMAGNLNQVGEQDHNHTINTLLKNLDSYDGFMVAATNFGDRIDEAVWRRFEIQIELALPGEGERRRILQRYFAPFVIPEDALAALAVSLETATPALMRSFCEHIKRQLIIGPKSDWAMDKHAVFDRVLTSVHPHPDVGKPRLWSHGATDKAVPVFPWPLERSLEAYGTPDLPADDAGVVAFPGGRR